MLTLPHLNSEETISASNWLILTSPQQTPLFISAKEIIISVKISKLLEETSLYSIKMSQKKPNNSNALVTTCNSKFSIRQSNHNNYYDFNLIVIFRPHAKLSSTIGWIASTLLVLQPLPDTGARLELFIFCRFVHKTYFFFSTIWDSL